MKCRNLLCPNRTVNLVSGCHNLSGTNVSNCIQFQVYTELIERVSKNDGISLEYRIQDVFHLLRYPNKVKG